MVQSMTAFARQETNEDWGSVCWEIRTVNHRYLEASFRLPEAFRELESRLRELLKNHFSRGKFDCTLRYKPKDNADLAGLKLNKPLAQQLLTMSEDIVNFTNHPTKFDITQILQWPGVIETEELDLKPIHQATIDTFEKTLIALKQVRVREGDALKALIEQRLGAMKTVIGQIKTRVPDIMSSLKQRILTRLNEIKGELDENRLEQEMIYMAQKLDIAEEVDRALTHIDEFQRVLNHEDVIGRRLDFLTQEMNREANTIASKSIDSAISHCAVELKVNIEQIREQVQNIE